MTAMPRTPVQLAAAIGFAPDVRRSFDWTHLGQSELPVGALLRLLRDEPHLCPPRSGHLGNWDDIALGRAGAMDFNLAICGGGLGYPLIYAFNQTEDDARAGGDWVYLPGSLARRGERMALPLATWDGQRFAVRDRAHPLFVPFVRTELAGEALALTQVHGRAMQRLATRHGLAFRLEASIIYAHRARLAPMLATLLEGAAQRENPRRAFADLISHAASLDGRSTRAAMRRDAHGYWLDGDCFASIEALIDAVFATFQAVAEPDAFFARIAQLPPRLPVMSGLLVGVLSAMLATHYPDADPVAQRAALTQPFNLHFHWGARDMAGFPPRRRGYFAERTTTRSIRQICDALVAAHGVDPLMFALMPAALFLLCPADAHPGDAAALAELFARVQAGTSVYAGSTDDRMMGEVDRIVRAWLDDAGAPLDAAGASLSPYFLHRFTARRGVVHDTEVPEASRPVEPEGFRALSLRQACMIIGALTDALGSPT